MKSNILLISCLFVCYLHLAACAVTINSACPGPIAENTTSGTEFGTLTTTETGKINFTIVSQNGTKPFSLTINGKLSTSKPLDYENETAIGITFKASDGTDNATLACNISITDVNDNAPVFEPSSYSKTIPNNTLTGTSIITVTATDADVSATFNQVTYSIQTGPNSTLFDIATNGTITSKKVIVGDKQNITITVVATDNGQSPMTSSAKATFCLGCSSDISGDSGKNGNPDNSGNTGTMLSMTFVGFLSMMLYFVI